MAPGNELRLRTPTHSLLPFYFTFAVPFSFFLLLHRNGRKVKEAKLCSFAQVPQRSFYCGSMNVEINDIPATETLC